MKKLLLILLALVLVLAVTACGKDEVSESLETESTVDTAATEFAMDVDMLDMLGSADELLSGVTDIIYADMSDEEKAAFTEAAAADGFKVIFGEDRTTTITHQNGTNAVQHPDGSFAISNDDGYVGQIGGEWPENDHTKLIPQPENGTLLTCEIADGTFTAMYSGSTVDDAVAYKELLIENGFSSNVSIDDSKLNEGAFSFRAIDSEKRAIATVNYIEDLFVVTVTK